MVRRGRTKSEASSMKIMKGLSWIGASSRRAAEYAGGGTNPEESAMKSVGRRQHKQRSRIPRICNACPCSASLRLLSLRSLRLCARAVVKQEAKRRGTSSVPSPRCCPPLVCFPALPSAAFFETLRENGCETDAGRRAAYAINASASLRWA